ncbi:caspase-8-like isoform X3 [Branchiostoma floridae x Branchiostoma japonicum]
MTANGDKPLQLYRILYRIAQKLDNTELEDLKFLCTGIISRSTQEEIDSPLKLFMELTKICRITEDDFSFLGDLLRNIGREDLLTQLNEPLQLYRILFGIAKELDNTELEGLKFLCTGIFRRSVLEHIGRPLNLLTELAKTGRITEDDFSFLEILLLEIGRQDLFAELKGAGKFLQEETQKQGLRELAPPFSPEEDMSSYDMSRAPRGVCVIINNIHFEDMAERDGAEGDTDRLRETFDSLGFTVVTFRDLDHAKMVATMKDQGKADHSNYDCFVCVIMSHGTMGKVYSSDDVGIDICELMKPVNAKKCPSLKGKPKLFFIQACQGEKIQRKEGFDHGEYDAKPVPFICHEADFFLGLATVPGYVARRDQDGAPYVHHLAKLLKDFGPTHDLSAIMAMVCDKMNDIHDDKFGWISSNHSTLRKMVVFNAK